MKKIKLIIEFIKLKHKGYTKENRMLVYAMKQYITFDTIVSFVECHLGNPTSVWDLPVYTLYDMYFRYNKMSNYQDTLNKLNAGCIDTKKHPINWEKINWASSIN